MIDQDILATPGSLDSGAIETFKTSLRGQLLLPGEEGYDQARAIWNGMFDKWPTLIVRPVGVSDVIQAVKFARAHQLLMSIKGGGHSFAGKAVCDHGLMLDMSLMRSIHVDPKNQTAWAEAGALLSDLDHETQAFGLATTAGVVSHTGIAGLTLGGGQGWLMNKYGLTIDNLLSVDVVLADGNFVKASKSENEDLFWAVRGGGGNFGVITSFEYQLHKVGPQVLAGMLIYPLEQGKEVLQFYREFSMNTPDEMSVIAALGSLPDVGKVVILAVGWCGDLAAGEEVLKPLRSFMTPMADTVAPVHYVQLQKSFDLMFPHGMHYYAKMGYITEMQDNFIDTIIYHMQQFPTPNYFVMFNAMKGVLTKVAPEATPYPYRRKQFYYDSMAQWTDVHENEIHIQMLQKLWKDTLSFTEGTAINFLGADDGTDRIRAAFGANYERLVALKSKYDPENFFRFNNNIVPT